VKKISVLLVLLTLLVITSCGPVAKFKAPSVPKPRTIAILPEINNSTDVNGGIVFRNLSQVQFAQLRGYTFVKKEIVDSLLNLAGITDGGQLKSISKTELQDILKADGLIYITITEMEYSTLGISSSRIVNANYKLYSNGALYWEDEFKVNNGKSMASGLFGAITNPVGALKEAAKDLGTQLVVKGLKTWLMDHELKPEMLQVIDKCYDTFPA